MDEFRRASDGKAFFLASLADFLSLFGVNQDIVAEVRHEEAASVSKKARHREHVRRSLESEEAIRRWLTTKYPGATIEYSDDFEYVVRHSDGFVLGVGIHTMTRDDPFFAIHRLRQLAPFVVNGVNAGLYSDFILYCVARSREACPRLVSRLRRAVLPGGPVTVSVGVVEEGTYHEVEGVKTLVIK